MKKSAVFVALVLFLLLGGYLVYQEGAMPVERKNAGVQMFVIKKGEGLSSIAKRLSAEGLIRNRLVFYFIVKKMGIEKQLQAGDYRLSKAMPARDIAKALTHGTVDNWVTVIEGLRKEEVAQTLSESFPISEIEFVERAKEGYLFPDTYLLPTTSTVDDIIAVMHANFDRKYSPELRAAAKLNGLTEREVVILASLVEKEARTPEDRKEVANIILKRERADWALQLDATVQYAIGFQRNERIWWKKELSIDDLAVDSSYNTYKHPGFPPAPICNPGLDSLTAAALATGETKYWYYISDKKGTMHYAVTLEEHNANIAAFLK